MNTEMNTEENYRTAAAQSFKWQVKTRTIPVSDITTTEIPLGFQSFGISALEDMVLITDYFAPAVCLNRVTVEGNNLRFEVVWVHDAWNGITRCRGGFPDMAYPSGANRLYTAFFAPDGKSVCVGRLDREFFLLTPEVDAQWRITARISLSEHSNFPLVHSAVLHLYLGGNYGVHTVESDARMDSWRTQSYRWETDSDRGADKPIRTLYVSNEGPTPIPRFHYGIAYLRGEKVLVASSHSIRGENATAPGIYVGGKLTVPGIIGSGICILPNGGALIAQYGQEEEGAHKGKPGALTYVPPALLAPRTPPLVAA